jgi:hypothetical protein
MRINQECRECIAKDARTLKEFGYSKSCLPPNELECTEYKSIDRIGM